MSCLMIAMGIAVIAVVRAIRSPVSEPLTYRVLFVLVVIGVVLISVLPEATFIIPALDLVGLDLVTILVALELSHYLISAGRMLGIPRIVMRTNPILWLYACSWALISVRAFLGKDLARA
jgi:hypothetical protein